MVVMAMLQCSESQLGTSLPPARPSELADHYLDSLLREVIAIGPGLRDNRKLTHYPNGPR